MEKLTIEQKHEIKNNIMDLGLIPEITDSEEFIKSFIGFAKDFGGLNIHAKSFNEFLEQLDDEDSVIEIIG